MTPVLSAYPSDTHSDAARRARALVRAERRFRRRADAYDRARLSTTPVDTWGSAMLVVEADRLVRYLARRP